MRETVNKLFNENKFARRAVLGWACWLITVVVLRVTEPEVLHLVNGHVAIIVTAVIGMLVTVIAFYQWSRQKDDTFSKPN